MPASDQLEATGERLARTQSRGRVIFRETPLKGAFTIDPEPMEDDRGFFARVWCQREFEAYGLEPRIAQCSIVSSTRAGTLRGMHYQVFPHQEVKLVQCIRGAAFDVIIDLRPDSPTFTRSFSVVLSSLNRRMLYIPRGFAQGNQTLEDDTELMYQMSEFYEPSAGRGVRWDDPAFGIQWPDVDHRVMADRDRHYPDFARASFGLAG